jgi:hypothetical protein
MVSDGGVTHSLFGKKNEKGEEGKRKKKKVKSLKLLFAKFIKKLFKKQHFKQAGPL